MEQQKFSIIQLNWSLAEFNHYICQCYPQVSLNLVGFELARADRGKKLQKVHVASVMELKMAIGKSRLYLIPLAEVYQESGSPEPEDPRRYTNITETIEERRALRQQQDDEFNASLLADREREMRRQILETQEERRLQVIQERRQRISFPEPSDGVPLRFKFPNGQLKTRRFLLSESIQRLFDFVGQDNSSTEIFSIREATSGVQIGSNTMSGSIEDHNITGFSTLYIMWTASPEEENSTEKYFDKASQQS
ncbi:FAS-associated factor 1-like isoform X3 [Pseudorasbora parva]|uniref:FAS-associated factor 1-like isoform X3 n=1 Tax=Pseudorasbora parva TaxID=51549 RepID=UPI00351E3BCE